MLRIMFLGGCRVSELPGNLVKKHCCCCGHDIYYAAIVANKRQPLRDEIIAFSGGGASETGPEVKV